MDEIFEDDQAGGPDPQERRRTGFFVFPPAPEGEHGQLYGRRNLRARSAL